jgi:hypothetical protein
MKPPLRTGTTFELMTDRKLIFRNESGLGDRIITILSGLRIAKRVDREFIFFWTTNYRCGCRLEDIFQVDFNVIYNDMFDQEPWVRIENPPLSDKTIESFKDSRKAIKIFGYQYTLPSGWHEIFIPQRRIVDLVEDFARQNFSSKMIGVHVRRLDQPRHAKSSAFIAEVESRLKRFPDSKIFLATDDGGVLVLKESQKKHSHLYPVNEGVVDAFKSRFGSRLVLFPKKLTDRSTKEGIVDGLVELLLLRKTGFLIGTACSKYSELAAIDKPHVLLRSAGKKHFLRNKNLRNQPV